MFICEMLYILLVFFKYEYFLYAYLCGACKLFNILVIFSEI